MGFCQDIEDDFDDDFDHGCSPVKYINLDEDDGSPKPVKALAEEKDASVTQARE